MQPISKPAWAFPEARREGNFVYNNGEKVGVVLTKENLYLIGFTDETKHLVIPAQVEVDGVEYPIVGADPMLFANNPYLTSVEIDMSNWDLENPMASSLFQGCTTLREVKISSRYPYGIARGMFKGCIRLKYVDLAPGLKSVGAAAFADCRCLQDLDLSHVDLIDYRSFASCAGLERVWVDGEVGESAFEGCVQLLEVTIGQNAQLGPRAFIDCGALKFVFMEEGVTEIGDAAFRDCRLLETILLPASLKHISDNVFKDCRGLSRIIFLGGPLEFKPPYPYVEVEFRGQRWWENFRCLTDEGFNFCKKNPDVTYEQFMQKFRAWKTAIPKVGDSGYFLSYREAVDAVEGGSEYNPEHENLYQQWMLENLSPREQPAVPNFVPKSNLFG